MAAKGRLSNFDIFLTFPNFLGSSVFSQFGNLEASCIQYLWWTQTFLKKSKSKYQNIKKFQNIMLMIVALVSAKAVVVLAKFLRDVMIIRFYSYPDYIKVVWVLRGNLADQIIANF